MLAYIIRYESETLPRISVRWQRSLADFVHADVHSYLLSTDCHSIALSDVPCCFISHIDVLLYIYLLFRTHAFCTFRGDNSTTNLALFWRDFWYFVKLFASKKKSIIWSTSGISQGKKRTFRCSKITRNRGVPKSALFRTEILEAIKKYRKKVEKNTKKIEKSCEKVSESKKLDKFEEIRSRKCSKFALF